MSYQNIAFERGNGTASSRSLAIGAALALALVGMAFFSGCDMLGGGDVVVGITASASGMEPAALLSRAVEAGDAVTSVSSYRVVFKKVEIGNSEADKHVLWESAEGQEFDVAEVIAFSGVKAVPAGVYQYARLTIGPEIAVDGSIDDEGTIYEGTGTADLDQTVYLWGTDMLNEAGQVLLAEPITIADGTVLNFDFAIEGTVTYLGGSADAAVLGLSKPTLGLTSE